MHLFLSPHNDDEALFGSFTIQTHQPKVMVVFDSYLQVARGAGEDCGWEPRRLETILALREMECVHHPIFLGLSDANTYEPGKVAADILGALGGVEPETVWAPVWHLEGHDQHNLVAMAALIMTQSLLRPAPRWYGTYTRKDGKMDPNTFFPRGDQGEGRKAIAVEPTLGQVQRKLAALSFYESQINRPDCRPHFLRDLTEYIYA